jgi:nucleotide-binding universal stress UspA family protein
MCVSARVGLQQSRQALVRVARGAPPAARRKVCAGRVRDERFASASSRVAQVDDTRPAARRLLIQCVMRTRPQLEAALSHARRRCRNCEVVIAVGSPAERIVATADDRGVGLIVLGTHGFRGLPDFVLGSVAAEVVRTSSIPVLVVPEPRPSGPGR